MGRKQKVTLGAIGVVLGYGALLSLFAPKAMAVEPSIAISKGDQVGYNELQAGKNSSDSRNYYIPFTITTNDISRYTVSVYAENPNMVGQENPNNVIKSVKGDKEYTLGEMQNEWGYRWNLGDKLEDAYLKNFSAMPTVSTELATYSPANTSSGTSYFVLGFGAGVNKELPKDTYSNKIIVSFVAEPVSTSIFSITNMQDMKPDICEATTTPNADATKIDTTGEHAGDPSYVPQMTLIDTRGGSKDNKGEYLVRKLADGNCWMVQNLELDILSKSGDGSTYYSGTTYSGGTYTGQTVNDTFHLTNEDTDLNSMTDFTPTIAQEKYGLKVFATGVGTRETTTPEYGWANNGYDGLRSYNYTHSRDDWSYSVPDKVEDGFVKFVSSSSLPSGLITIGDVPITSGTTTQVYQPGEYMRYGNLYNWTAATLGSGTGLSAGQEAPNSICPKGWKLSSIRTETGDSFANLFSSKFYDISIYRPGLNQMHGFPLNFMMAGTYRVSDGQILNRIGTGVWWTNTVSPIINVDAAAYVFYGNTDNSRAIDTGARNWRGYGCAVRCIAR